MTYSNLPLKYKVLVHLRKYEHTFKGNKIRENHKYIFTLFDFYKTHEGWQFWKSVSRCENLKLLKLPPIPEGSLPDKYPLELSKVKIRT